MKINILTFTVAIILSSCIRTEWSIELWRQKIENSNLSVYKFDAWGGRDSHIAGFKVLDSIVGFTQEDVLKSQGFTHLESIPNKDIISVLSLSRKSGNNKKVLLKSFQNLQFENFIMKFKAFEYNGYSSINGSLENYKFESFKETRDSLIFFSNDSKFVNGNNYDRISVPKGNIYLMTSNDNKKVVRITYEDVIIPKNGQGHNLKVGESVSKQIFEKTIYFDPSDSIDISEFSDYGIYKPVK